MVLKIPLENTPQTFDITLAGKSYLAETKWNDASSSWELSLTGDDGPVISAMPLVTGVDLLAQHKHMAVGGSLVVVTSGDYMATPTLDNLGSESNLFLVLDAPV